MFSVLCLCYRREQVRTCVEHLEEGMLLHVRVLLTARLTQVIPAQWSYITPTHTSLSLSLSLCISSFLSYPKQEVHFQLMPLQRAEQTLHQAPRGFFPRTERGTRGSEIGYQPPRYVCRVT
jgi:hypothetical protein